MVSTGEDGISMPSSDWSELGGYEHRVGLGGLDKNKKNQKPPTCKTTGIASFTPGGGKKRGGGHGGA